jgi:hypothetical protein
MLATLPTPGRLNTAGQFLIRATIASYFLATGIGILPGTNVVALTGLVLPPLIAGLLAAAITTTLAGLIIAGRHVQTAARCLALVLFWSSYVTLLQLGVSDRLGHFWRDLALLAALLLTSTEGRGFPGLLPAIARRHGASRVVGRVLPASIEPSESVAPVWKSSRARAPHDDESIDEIDNIFATA